MFGQSWSQLGSDWGGNGFGGVLSAIMICVCAGNAYRAKLTWSVSFCRRFILGKLWRDVLTVILNQIEVDLSCEGVSGRWLMVAELALMEARLRIL